MAIAALVVVAGCGTGRSVTASSHSSATASTLAPDTPVRSDGKPSDPIPKGPGIVGRVTAASGQVAGAQVQVASLDTPPAAVIELAVFTGADGRYYWPVRAGAWSVTVTAAGYRPVTARIDVPDNGLATLDLALTPGS